MLREEVFQYWFGGLRLRSPFRIPGLSRCLAPSGDADVEILLQESHDQHPKLGNAPGGSTLRIEVASGMRCHVGSREIRIERKPGTSDAEVLLYALGAAFGALCYQRGLLPLHASAVAVRGACIAFSGPSRAGKSTLCALLARSGYRVVSDDICVVRETAEGKFDVASTARGIRLRADAYVALIGAADPAGGQLCRGKYVWPVAIDHGGTTLPLAAVYHLEGPSHGETGTRIRDVNGIEAVRAVWESLYRARYARALGVGEHVFKQSTRLAGTGTIHCLRRPASFEDAGPLLDLLHECWGPPD